MDQATQLSNEKRRILPSTDELMRAWQRHSTRLGMVSFYKAALAPVLLAQAFRIRQTLPRLPEPAGLRAGSAGADVRARPFRVLFVGDSSAAGVGVDRQENALAAQASALLSARIGAQVQWQLVARSGVSTNQALDMVSEGELRPADVLVTSLGANDALAQRSPNEFIDDYQALVDKVVQKAGATAVVVTGVPPLHMLPAAPQPLRWYLGQCALGLDAALQEWARAKSGFAYISLQWDLKHEDLAPDRYHPGPGHYLRLAELVAENCASLLTAPGAGNPDAAFRLAAGPDMPFNQLQ
jgi:lysophospholipase L1-like esterase